MLISLGGSQRMRTWWPPFQWLEEARAHWWRGARKLLKHGVERAFVCVCRFSGQRLINHSRHTMRPSLNKTSFPHLGWMLKMSSRYRARVKTPPFSDINMFPTDLTRSRLALENAPPPPTFITAHFLPLPHLLSTINILPSPDFQWARSDLR